MKIKNREVSELKFAEYNPRAISKRQMKELKRSLTDFGFVSPVIVNMHEGRENVIVGGHQRLKAAIALGMKQVPVFEVELNLDQERELNIRLNKNTGEFDFGKLQDFFGKDELADWGFDDLSFYKEDVRTEDVGRLEEAKEIYDNAETMQITLYYSPSHFQMVYDALETWGESRAEGLVNLINQYEYNRG